MSRSACFIVFMSLTSTSVFAQNVGINTNVPVVELDIRTLTVDDGSDIMLGNSDQSHFLRLFIGRVGFPSPAIYWLDGDPLLLGTNLNVFTERMRITSVGNVGIGITSPTSRLQVAGGDWNLPGGASGDFRIGSSTHGLRIGVAIDGGGAGDVRMYSVGGSNKLIFGTGTSDRLTVNSLGNVGIAVAPTNSRLAIEGNDNDGTSAVLEIKTGTQSLILDANEIDAIGTSGALILNYNSNKPVIINTGIVATGYSLCVGGKVIAEEMRVQLESAPWPDYVFADNYTLPGLSQVESFIRTNRHLPGIPSAAQVESDGLLLGDMQSRMMQKIEELTLYIIRQDKEITRLTREVEGLKNQ